MRPEVPAPSHLDTVLALAPELEAAWPSRDEVAREATLGLTAMADEPEEKGGEEQPTEEPEAPETEQPEAEEEETFTESFNPDELPEEARGPYEAAYKRLQADFTRKRMAESQAVREGQEYREVVEGLANPETRPAIAQALGIPLAEIEPGFEEEDEFGLEEPDVAAALRQEFMGELQRRDQETAAVQAEQTDNILIGEGIESLEQKFGMDFTDEEIDFLAEQSDRYRKPDGSPDVDAAFQVLDALATNAQQRLIKRKTGAPRTPGRGTPANRKVDLNDEAQQEAAMADAVARVRASRE